MFSVCPFRLARHCRTIKVPPLDKPLWFCCLRICLCLLSVSGCEMIPWTHLLWLLDHPCGELALPLGLEAHSFAGVSSVVYLCAPGLGDPLTLHTVAMHLWCTHMGLLGENGLILASFIHPWSTQNMPFFSLGILCMINDNIKATSIVRRTFCSLYIILCVCVSALLSRIRIIVEEALAAWERNISFSECTLQSLLIAWKADLHWLFPFRYSGFCTA